MRVTKQVIDGFVEAAESGNVETVRKLIADGVPPDSVSSAGKTALFSAVNKGHHDVMLALLIAGATPNLLARGVGNPGSARSALHIATGLCDAKAIDLLLDHGADPRVRDQSGVTPALNLMLQWPLLRSLTREKHGQSGAEFLLPRLARMLECGVPLDQRDCHGRSIFTTSVVFGVPLDMLGWMIERGADVNAPGADGRRALHMAASAQEHEVIRFLVEHGADVNAGDIHGRSPIFMAHGSMVPDAATLAFLLELGANLEHRDLDGRTALAYALSESKASDVLSRTAVYIHAGADLDAVDFEGLTPRGVINSRRLTPAKALIAATDARNAMRQHTRLAPRASQ